MGQRGLASSRRGGNHTTHLSHLNVKNSAIGADVIGFNRLIPPSLQQCVATIAVQDRFHTHAKLVFLEDIV